MEDQIHLIRSVIEEYFLKRNIVNNKQQFDVIITTIHEWATRPGNGYVKPCFLKWALETFTDVRNNNLSAMILVEYLKLGYKHEFHRNIVMKYEAAMEANRIPEKPLSVLNVEARKLAWDKIVEMVKSGQIDYSSTWWVNAAAYLAKDLGFAPEKKYIEKMHEKAKSIYICDLKRSKELSESKTEISEISRIIEKVTSGGESEGLTMLRRKLIVEDYIRSNA